MNRRAIALIAAILFIVSWIFPVVAGLVRNPTTLPKWWGTVDVALAFVVAVGACLIPGLGRGNIDRQAEQTTYRIYRRSLHAILVVGVVVFRGGDRIKWANCATGFLWHVAILVHSPVVVCSRKPSGKLTPIRSNCRKFEQSFLSSRYSQKLLRFVKSTALHVMRVQHLIGRAFR